MAVFKKRSTVDMIESISKDLSELEKRFEDYDKEVINELDTKAVRIRERLEEIQEFWKENEVDANEYLDVKIEDIISHFQLRLHQWFHGDHLGILDGLTNSINQLEANLEDYVAEDAHKDIYERFKEALKELEAIKAILEEMKKLEKQKHHFKAVP